MADVENNQPSKKRAAGRELSRDNPGLDDEETSEQETGTFKKASDDVIANRRIVKVRRNSAAPSSNPFAGIHLVPPINPPAMPSVASTEGESEKTVLKKVVEKIDANQETEEGKPESTVQKEKTDEVDKSGETISVDEKTMEVNKADEGKKDAEAKIGEGEAHKDSEEARKDAEPEANKDADDVKTETGEKKEGGENVEKSVETSPFSSFQQLSSGQNAFTGLAGTGFSSSSFSFGSITKNDSGSGSPFSFGLPGNRSSSLFGHPGVSVNKSDGAGFPSMKEVPTETGEENEKACFTADSKLFEFLDGSWKERGKGEVKVNVSTTETGKARLVMRTKGNYRLILNACLYPDMKLTNMDKKGITFACINSAASEGKDGFSTHALKFKDASVVEEFRAAVTEHKGEAVVSLKTPENSPKASDN